MSIAEIIDRIGRNTRLIGGGKVNESLFEEKRADLRDFESLMNIGENIYSSYPQNSCEYVYKYLNENVKNIYENQNKNKVENNSIYKAYNEICKSSENKNVFNTETLQNITKVFQTLENSGLSSGYVDKFVNKVPFNVKNQEVIHNLNPMVENMEKLQNFSSNNSTSYSDITKNMVENNSSKNNSNSNFNINLGGITQNITEQNGDRIIDMLVEKLIQGLNSSGEMWRI